MKLVNILKEKKTSLIGFLIALTTLCKVFGWIPENIASGLAVFIPDMVNFFIVVYLGLTTDGK